MHTKYHQDDFQINLKCLQNPLVWTLDSYRFATLSQTRETYRQPYRHEDTKIDTKTDTQDNRETELCFFLSPSFRSMLGQVASALVGADTPLALPLAEKFRWCNARIAC